VAAARNRALHEARGGLIAFLDADDVWLPTKIEKQVAYLAAHPDVGWLSTNQVYFNETGITGEDARKRERLFTGDLVRNLFVCSGITPSTLMVRRSGLDDVGDFEESLRVGEDDNLWMRMAMKHRADLLNENLVMYRQTPGSLTQGSASLFDGIKAHIELLYAKYPEIIARLGPSLIEEKYAALYRDKAQSHFSRNELRAARRAYQESLKHRLGNPRVLFYWLCSFLPVWLVVGLRTLKRTGRGLVLIP
jgi:glycosyltransferase involved in cell wall biosynthesis